jgi:ribosomal protein S18 acetylase RimI-like enzyme
MLATGGYGLLPLTDVVPDQLAAFDCGTPHLNDFLRVEATPLHTYRLGFTSVVFHEDFAGPVGYFTLCNDAIPLTSSELFEMDIDETQIRLKAIPAVKIGRLAVASELQSQGVGAAIMGLLLGEVLSSSNLSTARVLVVDADNQPRVVSFYERQGFERSLWAEKQAKNNQKAASGTTVKMVRDILKALTE